MLSADQRAIVSACVPALKEHGLTLTSNFYKRLFGAHPALKNIFNMSHQATGEQQQALANAVLAYAEHIEAPGALAPALRVIAAKHASMGIRAEHYPLVGTHLLGAIGEVMGDAATPALMDAWAAAYDQLASILISAEAGLYQEAAAAPGGWSGWRPFRVVRADAESTVIRSIYLQPTDGGDLPPFMAGQFISVRRVDDAGLAQVRQYSLSDAPGRGYLRISVKREDQLGDAPAGVMSNILHIGTGVDDILELSFPQGDFTADTMVDTPLVLLSAGVGITPMLGIAEQVLEAQPERLVFFYHATRDRKSHAMADWLRAMNERHPSLHARVFYETVGADDVEGVHYHEHGRMDAGVLASAPELAEADFYVCGPRGFMAAQIDSLYHAGVESGRIHAEVFGAALR